MMQIPVQRAWAVRGSQGMTMHVIVRTSAATLSSAGAVGGLLGFVAMLLADIFFCLMFLRMFFSLFRNYRNYKIFVDTPEIQIRSAALGLVKIRGKAESDQLEPAPFSQKPCCFYKTTIETWSPPSDEEHSGHWQEFRTDLGGSRFLLADGTGKITIETPEVSASDINVAQTFEKEVDEPFAPLIEYFEKLDARRERHSYHPSECRLLEWAVLPGEEYKVIGDRIENPDPQSASADRYLVCAGKGMPFAIFSEAGESALFSSYAKTSVTVGAVVAVACMFLGSLALAIAMLVAGISKLEWANP
jgi:hypothetical protein